MTIVRRASTGGASLPGETPPASLAESLRRLDFYAVDLREGSRVGGCLSILTTMTIAVLFIIQVSALMTPSYVTDIVVDHSPDARVAVNVRIDFPRCECAYLALDVVDALGWRSSVKNISGENIYKHPIGGPLTYMNLEHVSPAEEELDSTRRAADYGAWTTDFDHYGNRRISYDVVGEEMFDRMVQMHKLLLVNFHAPWCRHCQAFAPIWEHAAEMTKLELRRVGKPRLTLGLASVDCTASDNVALCDKLHIQAYPNVRIYRAGSLHPSKRAHASEDAQSEDSFQYEVYHGTRNAESLAKFADSLLREIESAEDDGSFSPNVGHDGDGDGRVDSALRSPGCSVNGNFHVNRVPGAFYFVPRSRAHSIADVDMTHVIKHLSFGQHVPGRPSFVPRHLSKAWRLVPRDLGGRFASTGIGFTQFNADETRRTAFEHYMHVIPRTFAPIGESPMQVYEYTFSSNSFTIRDNAEERETMFYESDGVDDEFRRPTGPVVKFSYDTSPMSVVTRETRKPLLEWLLGCAAILGGLLTCSCAAEKIFTAASREFKRRIGKFH